MFRSNLQGDLPTVLGSYNSQTLRVEAGGEMETSTRGTHKLHTARCFTHTRQLSLKNGSFGLSVAQSPHPLVAWQEWRCFLSQLSSQDSPCLGLPTEGAILTHFQLHLCKVNGSRAGTVRRGSECYGSCGSLVPSDLGLPICEMGGWIRWVVSGAPDMADDAAVLRENSQLCDCSLKGVGHQGRTARRAFASEHSPLPRLILATSTFETIQVCPIPRTEAQPFLM